MSSTNDVLTIQLQDSNDVQMHFEIEKSSSDDLQEVFKKYSQFKNIPLNSLQFTFNGKSIPADESSASLGMSEEDNTIQVSLVGLALTKETIVQACTSGDTSSAVDLLTKNKDLCSEQLIWFDSDGQELSTPPMFICIDYGHTETVEKLLPSHKDILNTLKDGDGDYSLVGWASFAGKLDIVKMLVEAGAKADEEALSLAREENHNDVAEYLLKQVDLYADLEGDSDAIMEKACREGDSSKVRELLEEGNYNINKWKDDDGKYLAFSPMFLAVKNGHMEVIQLFAEKGMNMEDLDAIPEASE